MQEILFRGKRVDNGEWIKSDSIMQIKGQNPRLWVEHEGWVEVIPETVRQYIGLKDKNGTKIFKGDICKLKTGDICTITFYGGCFSFFNVKFGNIPLNDTEFGVVEYDRKVGITNRATDIEVIGNIHDNPELLEVDQ